MVEYESTFTKEEHMHHRMVPAPAVPQILKYVHTTFMEAVALNHDGPDTHWKKRGGVFCLADHMGVPLLTALIGEVEEGKALGYLSYCQEKAIRLGRHLDHQSSWESRNPHKSQWAGAIIIEGYIWSFSGLPELGDEAVMLGASCRYGQERSRDLMCRRLADEIAAKSQNPYWEGLRPVLVR